MRTCSSQKSRFTVLPCLLALFILALAPTNRLEATESNTPLFLPVVLYPGGNQASGVAVADVNGDGKPDLIVLNCGNCYGPSSITNPGSIGVMLGNGDGTFQPAVLYGAGTSSPRFVVVADVNGDGKLDLVVANRCIDNGCLVEAVVAVLLGNGDGTFQAAVTYNTGGLFATSVAVADVNGDGKPDLVVGNDCADSNCDGSVGVLLGNGDGTFQAASTYLTGGSDAVFVAVADVNSDGRPDLLAGTVCNGGVCGSGGTVAVLLGNGDGTFQSAVLYSSGGLLGFYGSGGALVVTDIDKDGKLDLVVENNECCNSVDASVGILLGSGDGTFKNVVTYRSDAGGPGTSVAVEDVDGDSKLDVVTTDECSAGNCINHGLVAVRLGNGDGTLQTEQTYDSGGFLTNSVAIADLNGDGKPDLVVANICADNTLTCQISSVGVLMNNSSSSCTTSPAITVSTTPTSLWPPNGKMVPIAISGTITDSGCAVKTAAYAVTDEYGEVQPTGAITLGPTGNYSFTILLQASRLGTDSDGRRYTVTVQASDNAGHSASNTSVVTVAHDQRH